MRCPKHREDRTGKGPEYSTPLVANKHIPHAVSAETMWPTSTSIPRQMAVSFSTVPTLGWCQKKRECPPLPSSSKARPTTVSGDQEGDWNTQPLPGRTGSPSLGVKGGLVGKLNFYLHLAIHHCWSGVGNIRLKWKV